jgi:hypothetical protein
MDYPGKGVYGGQMFPISKLEGVNWLFDMIKKLPKNETFQ